MNSETLLFLFQAGGKILNSRIGLVMLFLLYTSSPWGLGAKVDTIGTSLAAQIEIMRSTQAMEVQNTQRIAQLVERCNLLPRND